MGCHVGRRCQAEDQLAPVRIPPRPRLECECRPRMDADRTGSWGLGPPGLGPQGPGPAIYGPPYKLIGFGVTQGSKPYNRIAFAWDRHAPYADSGPILGWFWSVFGWFWLVWGWFWLVLIGFGPVLGWFWVGFGRFWSGLFVRRQRASESEAGARPGAKIGPAVCRESSSWRPTARVRSIEQSR